MHHKNLKIDGTGKIVSHYLQVKILFQWNTHLTTICKFFYKTLFLDSYNPTYLNSHALQLPHLVTSTYGNSRTRQLLQAPTNTIQLPHTATPTRCNFIFI